MSGNYVTFMDDLASNDDAAETADAVEAEGTEDTRLAGIIVND